MLLYCNTRSIVTKEATDKAEDEKSIIESKKESSRSKDCDDLQTGANINND